MNLTLTLEQKCSPVNSSKKFPLFKTSPKSTFNNGIWNDMICVTWLKKFLAIITFFTTCEVHQNVFEMNVTSSALIALIMSYVDVA
ncbi:hypothetical protein MTR_7g034315 [Medicago truncatula]|uniref:Uncharacterized protein n=1 Tax=Medicago truncatula TaxID=3880 RepID=A0A072TXP1_MEDTR|nr:hypothetical protein MTR_7g034315 [Medicago truncatula]